MGEGISIIHVSSGFPLVLVDCTGKIFAPYQLLAMLLDAACFLLLSLTALYAAAISCFAH